jgi:oligopeptide transport system substrate-binding protein
LVLATQLVFSACLSNNPYRDAEREENVYYSAYYEAPKHLDPVISYSSGQYRFLSQIYEPPLQYHYLKRPYQLIPLTTTAVPEPVYYDRSGAVLSEDAPTELVERAIYTIRLRPGVRFQPHPSFARAGDGGEDQRYLYHDLDGHGAEGFAEQLERHDEVWHFPEQGTRELTAADYVYQIKRMADPRLHCPLFSTMTNYIVGLEELGSEVSADLTRTRAERQRSAGAFYSQQADEREHPIWIDLDRFDLPGVRVVDRYTYEIELKRKYPQFVYWLAMPFFAPMPREADRFFAQAALVQRNLSLDNRPVGTGPYMLESYVAQLQIALKRNPNFHSESYPSDGDPGDREAGLLDDAGEQLPFLDRIVFKLEKEPISRWGKFQQGYYETAGITTEIFDQVIEVGSEGALDLSPDMVAKGIRLRKSVDPTTYYFAFNMNDDQVGGYSEDRRQLRQALSIALDIEEWVQIFVNGRAQSAHGPVPPGIFGHRTGVNGFNPVVYRWNDKTASPVRRSLEEAKELLAAAGYAGGKDAEGKPLVIYFDTYWSGPDAKARTDWLRKQFAKLDVDLQIRQTDYNRFNDKVRQGNYQLLSWGWHADYPDPENFLFLLYGPNGKIRYGGENICNYDNPLFDQLFSQVEAMPNGDKREVLLNRMVDIARDDAPWIWGYHPLRFELFHEWLANTKPISISYNFLKYRKVDPLLRLQRRESWNDPIWWPFVLFAFAMALMAVPVIVRVRRRDREVRSP